MTKLLRLLVVVLTVFCVASGGALLGLAAAAGSGHTTGTVLDKVVNGLTDASEPFNVLVLGGDKVNKNTDTMMLVNYNPRTAAMSLISLPRDTKVSIKGHGIQKLNAAYPIGGSALAVDTVSGLLGVKIQYSAFIDTAAFREIIDLLGGVDFEVPVDMNYDDPTQGLSIHLKKGMQHMDGAKSESFMRFRQPNKYTDEIMKFYDGSDLKRIEGQQNFVRSVISQKANVKYLPKLNSLMSSLLSHIETNMTLAQAVRFSYNASSINATKISMFRLPGDASNEGTWYYLMDQAATQEIIKHYFAADGPVNPANPTPAPATAKSGGEKNQPSAATPKPASNATPSATPAPVATVTPTASPAASPVVTVYPSPVPAATPTASPAQPDKKSTTSPVPQGTSSPKPEAVKTP